jgi:hypothetical protein
VRTHRIAVAGLLVASVEGACTSFESDDRGGPADAAAPDQAADGLTDAPAAPDAPPVDAPTDADASDGRPSGAIVFDALETSCGGGDLTVVTVEHVTDASAHSGVGACRICLTAMNGGYWHKARSSPRAATTASRRA